MSDFYSSMLKAGGSALGGGIIGGAMNWLNETFNPNAPGRLSRDNLNFQKENLAYQKQLQQTMFNREDNAVQRRVADLKAAGLNPMFAMGQGANAGQEIRTQAPQQDLAPAQQANDQRMAQNQMVMNMMQMQADITKTNAETDAIKAGIINDSKRLDLDMQGHALDVQKFRQQLTMDRIHVDNETARLILEQDREKLQRQYYTLQKNRDEVDKVLKKAQTGHLNEQSALLRLQQLEIPIDIANKILQGQIDLRDFILSVNRGMRFKDGYYGMAGATKSVTDMIRDQNLGFTGESVSKVMQDMYDKAIGGIK